MLSPAATEALERAATIRQTRALMESGAGRTLRRSAGLSLRDMGDALGVSWVTVFRWETGERRPSGDNAVAYAEFIDALQTTLSAPPHRQRKD